MNQSGPLHLNYTLSRAEFEKITRDLLERCKAPVTKALNDANVSLSEVDEVILVGGSTRMPAVQELVKNMTGKQPNMSVNPDEVVCNGAAVQGGVLTGDVEGILLLARRAGARQEHDRQAAQHVREPRRGRLQRRRGPGRRAHR